MSGFGRPFTMQDILCWVSLVGEGSVDESAQGLLEEGIAEGLVEVVAVYRLTTAGEASLASFSHPKDI